MKKHALNFAQTAVLVVSLGTFGAYFEYSSTGVGPLWTDTILGISGWLAGLLLIWAASVFNQDIIATKPQCPTWARIILVSAALATALSALLAATRIAKEEQINAACERIKQSSPEEAYATPRCRGYFVERHRADRRFTRD